MINERKLDEIMLELGHTENVLGTGYIRKGVFLYDGGLTFMTKELYPAIAEASNSTWSRVERAMRQSISNAWARGNVDAQQQFFGYTVRPDRGVPTVGEYISRMARICHED